MLVEPNPDGPSIAKRLHVLADLIAKGAIDHNVVLGIVKITRELIGKRTDETHLNIESQFGALTRKGLVRIEINNEWAMLDPDEARRQASYLIECASSAEFDEFVYSSMAPKIGLDDEGASALLMHFREWRSKGSS